VCIDICRSVQVGLLTPKVWSCSLGVEDSLLLPTLTHIHAAVIPILASDGTIFVDGRAHKTIWDGCVLARARGASLVRFPHHDPEALEEVLRRHPKQPRVVCTDGVNSMTGNPPTCRRSPPWPASMTRCCTWTTPTASGSSGSAAPRSLRPTGCGATGWSATWASATTMWC
jgi:hypothetical protein